MRSAYLRVAAVSVLGLGLSHSAAAAAQAASALIPYAPTQVAVADYDRAARLLAPDAASLVRNATVSPIWLGRSSEFWYRRDTVGGGAFMLVDAAAHRIRPAFDHRAIAAALSAVAGKSVSADVLPFSSINFDARRTAINFEAWGTAWRCTLKRMACHPAPPREAISGVLVSPDGTHAAFRRDRNLWIKDLHSGAELELTHDGAQFNEYGWLSGNSQSYVAAERTAAAIAPMAIWSPDSTQLLTHRIDERQVAATSLWQSAPGGSLRPKIWEFHQSFAGDVHEPQTRYVAFNILNGRRLDIQDMPNPGAFYAPVGGAWSWWAPDSKSVFFLSHDRYFKCVGLYRWDIRDGSTHLLLEEKSSTYVGLDGSYQPAGRVTVRLVQKGTGGDLVWFSERDGWGHLYRYDLRTGVLKNRITSGSWAVYGISHIDEQHGIVYFLGAGREPGRNPYEAHVYRVNLDGTGLRLLTPEDANHAATFAPNGQYFVDTYSRPDTRPVSVLRAASNGRVLMTLESADSFALESAGWRWPLPFTVKARDGATDLYGTMFRPSHMEGGQKYPVIDLIYPAPWHIFPDVASFNGAASGLNRYYVRQALAELGFIVVNVQGLGTPGRGKAFLDRSYGKLEDGPGLADHVAAITELAAAHPEIDLARVGVFGHSSGGYGALLAMLRFPDFFKVGVAGAPAVDMRGLVGIVLEGYQGPPGEDAKNYAAVALGPLAGNLKGRLLLAFSDLDENASAATAVQFIEALNRTNRNYDVLVMPNRDHSFSTDPYYLRRVSDYFVRNLMGSEPPPNYTFPVHGAGEE
jgi:dipeptidyl-peptidase-4